MDFREHKLETDFVICVLFFVALIYLMFSGSGKTRTPRSAAIRYEMPRPKNQVQSDFSLEGREIDYSYDNPFDKKDAAKKKAGAIDKKKGVVKDAGKKKADAKKVAQQKKKENSAEKKTDEQAKTDAPATEGTEDSNWNGPTSHANNGQQGKPTNGPTERPVPQEEDQRTAQQWRSLLNAQPTQENMDKLVQAYSRREVTDAEFYVIVEDLLKNQKSETQKVGLYGIRTIHSTKAFTLMSDYYENLNTDTKRIAGQIMLAYGQSARLDVLAQVLRSGHQKATVNALNVVTQSLQNNRTDPRDVRAGAGSRNSRRYSVVLPAVQQLQQSGQGEVAQLAGQVYGQLIQIGVTTPGNAQQASAIYQGPGLVY